MTPGYFERYKNLVMRRDERGILEVRQHTNGGSLGFSASARTQLMEAFFEISRDRDNRVVILTGTGPDWCAEMNRAPEDNPDPSVGLAERWDRQFWEGRKLLQNMLDIECPMIAAVNGPALIHSEYILTCDIVIASERAAFQDLPHLTYGVSPTDGVHVLWPFVLGPSRGRYFLLTQQKLDAAEALSLGVCQEVVAPDRLMDRAWEIAGKLVEQPVMSLRYARVGLTQRLKKLLVEEHALGLAVESLSALSKA